MIDRFPATRFAALAALGLLLSVTIPPVSATEYITLEDLREDNKAAMVNVRPGMDKARVLRVMGDKEAATHGGSIRNPFRELHFTGTDGQEYEAMLFYTERHTKFGKVRDTDCTPVVFRQGQVVAIGYPALRKLRGW